MKAAIDDLLQKVRLIAETPKGDLLCQLVDLLYHQIEEEYDKDPLTEEDLEAIRNVKEDVAAVRAKQLNYKDLFSKMEATLRKESSLSEEYFERNWGRFKNYHYKNDTDNDVFWKLIQVIFYSGMNAGIVTSKLPTLKRYFYNFKEVKEYDRDKINEIMNDDNIIRYRRKIEACIENAKKFNNKINQYGAFANYLESFGDLNDGATLERMKNQLNEFKFLGPITAYHFMLDLGLNVWKPDRVICRILKRLDLIDNLEDIDQAIEVGREIANQVELPIRYIDIIFVKYGQMGEEKSFGLRTGICLEKTPRCSICGIKDYCTYQKLR